MIITFVPCLTRSDHPPYYACWLTAGGVTVRACGATKGRAYIEALVLAYNTIRGR